MLYILVLNDKTGFKIGITNRYDLKRIDILSRIYNFNLHESFIIESTNYKTCKILEKQLLSDYAKYKYNTESKLDGHSEFIQYKKLNDVLDDILFKTKHNHLGIKIHNFINFIELKTFSEKIKIGLENARKEGRIGGRPRIDDNIIIKISEFKRCGYNIMQISKELNISRGTIYSYLK